MGMLSGLLAILNILCHTDFTLNLFRLRRIEYLNPNFYSGPAVPPSFLVLQKCTARKMMAVTGMATQCHT